MITESQLREIFPDCANPEIWAKAISSAWERFGIDSRNARAGFLGICGNETGGFRHVREELMHYSPARSLTVFGAARANRCVQYCTLDHKGRKVRDDNGRAFASCIYANMLGNGPMDTGDGWTYRGAGIIQLTGKANHAACAKALGLKTEQLPELIASDPKTSAAAAAWFMVQHARILPLLESPSEADFLKAARQVGLDPDGSATVNRLAYRKKALGVVLPAGTVRKPDGNITIRDIKDSTIVKDANTGVGVGTAAAGAGALAPVVTALAGADWKTAAVIGLVVLGLAGLALLYFLRIKKARRKMHADGIA